MWRGIIMQTWHSQRTRSSPAEWACQADLALPAGALSSRRAVSILLIAAGRRVLTAGCHVVEQEESHGRAEAQQGAHEHRRHALLHRPPRVVGQPAGQAWRGLGNPRSGQA